MRMILDSAPQRRFIFVWKSAPETTAPSTTDAAGATTASFTVTPVDDNVEETDETFTVHADAGTATLPAGYALSQGADGTGTILNDDASLAIAAGVGNGTDEGTGGTTLYLYTVTRTGDTSDVTTVDWAVSSANMNGADFDSVSLPSGSLTFAAGETTKTITINVTADSTEELDEDFTVTLSNAAPGAGTSITTASATGTVDNDDNAEFTVDSVPGLESCLPWMTSTGSLTRSAKNVGESSM